MNIEQIKKRLSKEAIVYQTGGRRQKGDKGESWIGKAVWGREDEDTQSDYEPLCTIYLENLPRAYIPEELHHFDLITVYVDYDVLLTLEENITPFFKINCYENINELQKINKKAKKVKPTRLIPYGADDDIPSLWDDYVLNPLLKKELERLEEEDKNGYFAEIVLGNNSFHKIGGYPSFVQEGVFFGEDYPFMFQICSEMKADLDIVDQGNFYFFYNSKKQDWIVHCDFF